MYSLWRTLRSGVYQGLDLVHGGDRGAEDSIVAVREESAEDNQRSNGPGEGDGRGGRVCGTGVRDGRAGRRWGTGGAGGLASL